MGSQRDASLRAHLSTINVILAILGRTGSCPSRVLSITRPYDEDPTLELKRAWMEVRLVLSFLDEDKVGIMMMP